MDFLSQNARFPNSALPAVSGSRAGVCFILQSAFQVGARDATFGKQASGNAHAALRLGSAFLCAINLMRLSRWLCDAGSNVFSVGRLSR